jgi:hypothetical protein
MGIISVLVGLAVLGWNIYATVSNARNGFGIAALIGLAMVGFGIYGFVAA